MGVQLPAGDGEVEAQPWRVAATAAAPGNALFLRAIAHPGKTRRGLGKLKWKAELKSGMGISSSILPLLPLVLTTSGRSSHWPWPLLSLSAACPPQGSAAAANCKAGGQTAPPAWKGPTPQVFFPVARRRNGPRRRVPLSRPLSHQSGLPNDLWAFHWKNPCVEHHLGLSPPLRRNCDTPSPARCVSWGAAGCHRAGDKWNARRGAGGGRGKQRRRPRTHRLSWSGCEGAKSSCWDSRSERQDVFGQVWKLWLILNLINPLFNHFDTLKQF